MYLKIHPTPEGGIVAVCDSELMGVVLSDGKRRLDLKKHASFYRGEKADERAVRSALSGAANANIVGKKSIAAAKSAGLDVSCAVLISGIPHLQIYRMP